MTEFVKSVNHPVPNVAVLLQTAHNVMVQMILSSSLQVNVSKTVQLIFHLLQQIILVSNAIKIAISAV